jgi:hypothetical protein
MTERVLKISLCLPMSKAQAETLIAIIMVRINFIPHLLV